MQSSGKSTFQFSDNRPEAVRQRKLQKVANNCLQAKQATQLQAMANNRAALHQPLQKKENNTSLPDNLKSGIENLSGYSMDDVKVHFNSAKPAQLNAHAYAQGSDIHLASGQEKHLPHEAWHVVQQKQGRVKPTIQMKGNVKVNDDIGLEKEADVMGAKALLFSGLSSTHHIQLQSNGLTNKVVQQVEAVVLKNLFAFGDVKNRRLFHAQIGEEAFIRFRTAALEEVTPLVDFFKGQPLPIAKANDQCDLLFPHAADAPKLALVIEALTNANYDPTVAGPVSTYLLRYLEEGTDTLKIAKSILAENGNDPIASEVAMQTVNKNVQDASGRTKFDADYLDATGKSRDLDRNDGKNMDTTKISKLEGIFPGIELATGAGSQTAKNNRDAVNDKRAEKIKALDAKKGEINGLIASFTDDNPGTAAINWCLKESKSDVDKLKQLIAFVKATIAGGIVFGTIGPLVTGQGPKLWPLITKFGGASMAKLPKLIQKATLPTLETLLDQTGDDLNKIENWLVTNNILIGPINTLLAKNYSKAIFVELITWLVDINLTVKLCNLAPDKQRLEQFITEIDGDATAKRATEVSLGGHVVWTDVMDLDPVKAQVKKHRMAQGRLGQNDTVINTMSKTAIAGDKLANEQKAITDALATGFVNTLHVCENRGAHNNNDGHLPFDPGVGNYVEWGISPHDNHWPGARRLVQDVTNGHIYYTWTHYGDQGVPAFVLLT